MTIFGVIGFDRVAKIDVGLVTNAPTPATQQFIDQLKQVSAFDVHQGSIDDERAELSKGNRAVVVQIPDQLMPDPTSKTAPSTQTITVLKSAAQEQYGSIAIQALSQMLDKTTLAVTKAPNLFAIDVQDVSARKSKYIDFLLPGIVAMSIMQMAVFSVAFVFADYKEKGVLKRLLATPMRPYQFVTANVITRLLVALAQSAILMGVGLYVFKAHVVGSFPLIFLIAVLGGVMFLGLGFVISGFSNTVEAVPAIANLVVFPMLFLSGVFFPTTSMPDWLQHIVGYLPLTFFAHAMREVAANAATIFDVRHDLLWMGIWSVILVALAIVTFRFEERRV